MIELSEFELNLIREWFDLAQDTHPKFLGKNDYELAKKIYTACNMRVPNSIEGKANG